MASQSWHNERDAGVRIGAFVELGQGTMTVLSVQELEGVQD